MFSDKHPPFQISLHLDLQGFVMMTWIPHRQSNKWKCPLSAPFNRQLKAKQQKLPRRLLRKTRFHHTTWVFYFSVSTTHTVYPNAIILLSYFGFISTQYVKGRFQGCFFNLILIILMLTLHFSSLSFGNSVYQGKQHKLPKAVQIKTKIISNTGSNPGNLPAVQTLHLCWVMFENN